MVSLRGDKSLQKFNWQSQQDSASKKERMNKQNEDIVLNGGNQAGNSAVAEVSDKDLILDMEKELERADADIQQEGGFLFSRKGGKTVNFILAEDEQ